MKKATLKEKIKEFIAYRAFKLFLWASNETPDTYWRKVYENEKAYLERKNIDADF